MIGAIAPYPAYKDSGLPWLGMVPAHWKATRLKRVSRFAYGDALPNEARQAGDVLVYGSNGRVGVHSVANTCAPCIVIGRKGSFGKVNYSPANVFAIDTTFIVDERFTGTNLRWLYYLLGWLRLDEVSKDSTIPGLDREDAYQRIVPFPTSVDEQSAIARFLDYADRRINRYIRAKRRLIELLNEQRQVIIHQAVTCGLDPNVRLKPSGVEWLSDIPEHWEVRPFTKSTVERSDYRGATPEKVDEGVLLVTAKNIRKGWIDYESSKEYIPVDRYQEIMRRGLPKLDDILLTTEAPLGNVALVDREDIALAQRVIRFRMDERVFHPKFVMYSMVSTYFQSQLQLRATGSTAEGIKASKLPQLIILCPPPNEQFAIVKDLDAQLGEIEHTSASAQVLINLVREYRTRLIADVVTGKLDVRGVELPELSEGDSLEEWSDDTSEDGGPELDEADE